MHYEARCSIVESFSKNGKCPFAWLDKHGGYYCVAENCVHKQIYQVEQYAAPGFDFEAVENGNK